MVKIIKYNKKGINAFLSGALAGFFSMMVNQKSNRSMWGIFLLSRAIQFIINSQENRGRLFKKKELNWIMLFCLIWLFLGYNIQFFA